MSIKNSEMTEWVKVIDLTTKHMLVEADGYLWNITEIKDLGRKVELSVRNDFSMTGNKKKCIIGKGKVVLCMKQENTFEVYNPNIDKEGN